jgi:hypothetical protein
MHPAWPVGQLGGWTGLDLIKDRLWQQPSQTRGNPDETCFFFFQTWDFPKGFKKTCFQEKSLVFSMWDKKPFGLNTST